MMWEMVKLLAAVINPVIAKDLLKDDKTSEEVVDSNFEETLKRMDPNFDFASYKQITDSIEQ